MPCDNVIGIVPAHCEEMAIRTATAAGTGLQRDSIKEYTENVCLLTALTTPVQLLCSAVPTALPSFILTLTPNRLFCAACAELLSQH
jgi:hypothetical protein